MQVILPDRTAALIVKVVREVLSRVGVNERRDNAQPPSCERGLEIRSSAGVNVVASGATAPAVLVQIPAESRLNLMNFD